MIEYSPFYLGTATAHSSTPDFVPAISFFFKSVNFLPRTYPSPWTFCHGLKKRLSNKVKNVEQAEIWHEMGLTRVPFFQKIKKIISFMVETTFWHLEPTLEKYLVSGCALDQVTFFLVGSRVRKQWFPDHEGNSYSLMKTHPTGMINLLLITFFLFIAITKKIWSTI